MRTGFCALTAFVVATATMMSVTTVHSQQLSKREKLCVRLEGNLASLQRQSKSKRNQAAFQKYDRASHKQRAKVDKLRRAAKRQNCDGGGFLFFRKKPGPQCKRIKRQLRTQTAKLDKILDRRNRYASDPKSNNRKKRDLIQALAENRCGPQYERYARKKRSRTLFGLPVFGSRGDRSDRFNNGSFTREFYDEEFASVGTYRTLCVRTCDGYYFPISFSTTERNFDRDQAACQNMCPGTDTALYTHQNPGQESQDMVSIAGEPYTNLPTAFLYRKEYKSSCSCKPAEGYVSLIRAGDNPVSATVQNGTLTFSSDALGDPTIPLPDLRPNPAEDPETLLSVAGGFIPQVLNEDGELLIARRDKKSIRRVGPQYFYGRSVAEVDQAQDHEVVQ